MGTLIPRKKQKPLIIPKSCSAQACAKRDFKEFETNSQLKEKDVMQYCLNARIIIIARNE